jgi:hypothetical protein
MSDIKARFKAWHDNRRFNGYLDRVSEMLSQQEAVPVSVVQHVLTASVNVNHTSDTDRQYTMTSIFAAPVPILPDREQSLFIGQPSFAQRPSEPDISLVAQAQDAPDTRVHKSLKTLCRDLGLRAIQKSEAAYVKALRQSCAALESYETGNKTQVAQLTTDTLHLLQDHLKACMDQFQLLTQVLAQAVQGETGSTKEIAFKTNHTPRISPITWLRQLNLEAFELLPASWKTTIIEYALSITYVHRAQRMTAIANKPLELAQELQNSGHTNWSPWDFPETLLLEAESGILVREVQENIAQQMRSPLDGSNAVCQLNMGEGKSSVIVPMLAAALANSKKLVRIVVAKPQSKQMLQVLISRLGGSLNRRVYHLPFSRDLRLTSDEAETVRSLCEECIKSRGVVLAQPEHILSFKLMGLEQLMIGQGETASSLLKTQEMFEKYARDIVDESDENFSPHFELVYTMGSQQAIDFAPQRWILIHQILGLVSKFALEVKKGMPVAMDYHHGGDGMFPRVRLLRNDAVDQLLGLIAKHIVDHGLTGLSTMTFSGPDEKTALETYILQPVLTPDQIQAVESSKFWTDSTKHAILLVRGIIACGILRFALSSKRWRVNFGLDSGRTPTTLLAVPYRFKDGPSPRAEFSHPDVLIVLTLLSYYYGGLSDQQMFSAFKRLANSDQSAIHYSEWVSTAAASLPAAFRTLSGINIRDRQHCIQHVFPHLRFSKACIEYYLSRLVFPKEVKQFTSKLSASGWDMGAPKTHPTTGFSGTKDTMHLLPLAVKHLDLPSQTHISALVLGYLLETSNVELLPPRDGSTDAEHVLNAAINSNPEIRVVFLLGGAIHVQKNKEVVESWLSLTNPANIQAAVFFQDEELSVLDRTGRVEALQISPFAKQLDVCIVYLDEAHTRGTDLRLPRHYRACLTLGSGITKDKLIQGCMRMRQLGKGQSVLFLVPEEIATKIYQITSGDFDEPITVPDVLVWSCHETWADLRKSMPLWAVQGERFISHQHLVHDGNMTKEQAEQFLEDEGQTLESRYQAGVQGNKLVTRTKEWDMKNPAILSILTRCKDFGAMGLNSADLEEEQERELAPEQEEERQIERPKQMEAASHNLHPHVQSLVSTGRITKSSEQFTPAFQTLASTSSAELFDLSQFPTELLVTADFMKTIKKPKGPVLSDSFQRSVQWVLSIPDPKKVGTIQQLVIISPFEANKLLPKIRKSTKVTLHLYAPCVNSTYAPLDALDLYAAGRPFDPMCVPRSLTTQLNLFAGSLYLRSYAEYTELCEFLGLSYSSVGKGQEVAADGFITPAVGGWGFKASPVPLLRSLLMRIRREGEGLEKTHLGRILSGFRLEETDFETGAETSGT